MLLGVTCLNIGFDLIRGKAKGGGGNGGVTAIYGLYKAVCVFNQNENAYISYQPGRSNTHQNEKDENITGACVRSMYIEFNLPHNMQFYRFENGLVDRALE